MSFPNYKKYKDSGEARLGQVPAHWVVRRLEHVCDFQSGKAHEPYIADDGQFVCGVTD